MKIRPADFAGSWYPGDASTCKKIIEEMSAKCLPCPQGEKQAIGGIVPHAGWFYSGQIACNVIRCLKRPEPPDTCIVFGRHLHVGSRNYIMTQGGWDTPFGPLEIDGILAEKLAETFQFTVETASFYEPDNTIELQLPFIKYFFPDIKIVPMGLPPKMESIAIAEKTAQITKKLGRTAVVLGSTDLTHYGYNYGYAPKGTGEEAVNWVKNENDRRMVDLMLGMDEKGVITEGLEHQNACCAGAVSAAIFTAKGLGAQKGEKIVYQTSYDIRPDTSFVGYVGIVYA